MPTDDTSRKWIDDISKAFGEEVKPSVLEKMFEDKDEEVFMKMVQADRKRVKQELNSFVVKKKKVNISQRLKSFLTSLKNKI